MTEVVRSSEQAARDFGKNILRGHATIPTKSTFLSDGKLTPAEFVAAGDALRAKCPRFHWLAGDPKLALAYLPADKQFLEIKGVPCRARAKSVTEIASGGETDDGDWVAPAEVKGAKKAAAAPAAAKASKDDEDDIFDFSFDPTEAPASSGGGGTGFRTYDATITYDIYYLSPRLYLRGYAEDGKTLLTSAQIMEDMSEEHAKKTATVDPHPHLGIPTASIHPCKHSVTMKAMIEHEKAEGRQLKPEQYFFFFMKFVASAIPTIEISNTVEAE